MNSRKLFHLLGAGTAVLGLALCVPAALLAQSPAQDSSTAPQANSQSATGTHHRRHSAKRQLQHLTKTLNLTADQQQQMLPILQDQNKQMRAMRNDTSLSPEQRRDQSRTLMQDTHQKLEAIMTDSQKQQFEQMIQQRRQRGRNRGAGQGPAGNPPPPPPDAGTPPPQL